MVYIEFDDLMHRAFSEFHASHLERQAFTLPRRLMWA